MIIKLLLLCYGHRTRLVKSDVHTHQMFNEETDVQFRTANHYSNLVRRNGGMTIIISRDFVRKFQYLRLQIRCI